MEGKSGERRQPLLEDGSVLVLQADLIDAGGEYIVCVELPGVERSKADVQMNNVGVQICGECECDKKYAKMGASFVKRELIHTKACRYLAFPDTVNPEKAVAMVENGLLEIRAPKVELIRDRTPSRPIKIPIEIPITMEAT